jgi:hypothetical protein
MNITNASANSMLWSFKTITDMCKICVLKIIANNKIKTFNIKTLAEKISLNNSTDKKAARTGLINSISILHK